MREEERGGRWAKVIRILPPIFFFYIYIFYILIYIFFFHSLVCKSTRCAGGVGVCFLNAWMGWVF